MQFKLSNQIEEKVLETWKLFTLKFRTFFFYDKSFQINGSYIFSVLIEGFKTIMIGDLFKLKKGERRRKAIKNHLLHSRLKKNRKQHSNQTNYTTAHLKGLPEKYNKKSVLDFNTFLIEKDFSFRLSFSS